MTAKTIYESYVPTVTSRKDKREVIYNQVVDIFTAECEKLDADSADDVEIKITESHNLNMWEPIKKDFEKFENQTKLTIFESVLMTVKRRDKILKDRKDNEPKPEPEPENSKSLIL